MQLELKPAEVVPDDQTLKAQFTAFVADPAFPCLGAKAAFGADSESISIYRALGSASSSRQLARDLEDFVHSEMGRASAYATFIAVFREPRALEEQHFEQLLWAQLQQLHEIDATRHKWNSTVASDPSDQHFSFSFAGRAFYVIGLHAGSSRLARRFLLPTLVFNSHEQFERLRHDGKWRRMQAAIRTRDHALQGSVNPMLSDFGEQSEARQYSGRRVDETWAAPFRAAPDCDENEQRCPFRH